MHEFVTLCSIWSSLKICTLFTFVLHQLLALDLVIHHLCVL